LNFDLVGIGAAVKDGEGKALVGLVKFVPGWDVETVGGGWV
jgi:hypothetical protein